MDIHVWPNFVCNMDWPKDGITYSYEHRGYIRPEKVELWLKKAFGVDKARYVVSSASIHARKGREAPSSGSDELTIVSFSCSMNGFISRHRGSLLGYLVAQVGLRKATLTGLKEERRWMEDSSSSSGVQVAECGWLSLDGGATPSSTSTTS